LSATSAGHFIAVSSYDRFFAPYLLQIRRVDKEAIEYVLLSRPMKGRHVVCATFVVIILLIAVPIARGDDQLLAMSVSTEYFETEDAPEPRLEYNLAGAYGQDQAAEKKQESLFAGPIAIYLDGILCHAASVITLLFKMAQ
jgi:hypothetical protein